MRQNVHNVEILEDYFQGVDIGQGKEAKANHENYHDVEELAEEKVDGPDL